MKYGLWKLWRRKHPEYRNPSRKRYYDKTAHAINHHQPWTMLELNLVIEHKIPDALLSEILGRSTGSIQVQRSIYNKVGDKNV